MWVVEDFLIASHQLEFVQTGGRLEVNIQGALDCGIAEIALRREAINSVKVIIAEVCRQKNVFDYIKKSDINGLHYIDRQPILGLWTPPLN